MQPAALTQRLGSRCKAITSVTPLFTLAYRWATAMLMLTCLLLCSPSHGANAPFYWWQSKVTGKLICKQTSPGEGWLRFSGPFADGGCRQAIPPKV